MMIKCQKNRKAFGARIQKEDEERAELLKAAAEQQVQ